VHEFNTEFGYKTLDFTVYGATLPAMNRDMRELARELVERFDPRSANRAVLTPPR
jgi:hypothetical protein